MTRPPKFVRATAEFAISVLALLLSLSGCTVVKVLPATGPLAVAEAGEPFQHTVAVLLEPGTSVFVREVPIPPGKRLIVKYATAHARVPDGQHVRFLISALGAGGQTNAGLPAHDDGPTTGGSRAYSASESVLMYSDGFLQVRVDRSASTGHSDLQMAVSGHLVPRPSP